MSTQSAIEWTDATWNPVRGCVKVSPGCAHCYAETFAERWRGVPGHPYEQGFDLMHVPAKLDDPLKWRSPKRVFVNSMSDLFQDGVDDQFISQVFAVMALTPQHTFQVLTKRAARLRAYVQEMSSDPDAYCFAWAREYQRDDGRPTPPLRSERWPLPNVWLGVSVENQHFADERIPLLLDTPAAVRFISAEPLLERIDLTNALWTIPGARLNRLHWIIVGGESGSGARPFELAWARWLLQQGRSADVPVFVKQLGAFPRFDRDETQMYVRSKKGGDMAEWPSDLRVREFPSLLPACPSGGA